MASLALLLQRPGEGSDTSQSQASGSRLRTERTSRVIYALAYAL